MQVKQKRPKDHCQDNHSPRHEDGSGAPLRLLRMHVEWINGRNLTHRRITRPASVCSGSAPRSLVIRRAELVGGD
jgi:hypothetical protein